MYDFWFIIWNIDSQLEADFIKAFLEENKIQQMDLSKKSFVISRDTIGNYNQIKGREIIAIFDSTTAISNVNVDGNGESLYFALDDFNSYELNDEFLKLGPVDGDLELRARLLFPSTIPYNGIDDSDSIVIIMFIVLATVYISCASLLRSHQLVAQYNLGNWRASSKRV